MAQARLDDGVPVTAGWFVVGAGDGPALVLAVGARQEKGSARYPVDPAAVRHRAGVESETETPYARYSEPERGPAPPL